MLPYASATTEATTTMQSSTLRRPALDRCGVGQVCLWCRALPPRGQFQCLYRVGTSQAQVNIDPCSPTTDFGNSFSERERSSPRFIYAQTMCVSNPFVKPCDIYVSLKMWLILLACLEWFAGPRYSRPFERGRGKRVPEARIGRVLLVCSPSISW